MKVTLAIIAAFACLFFVMEVNGQLTEDEITELKQRAGGPEEGMSLDNRFVS